MKTYNSPRHRSRYALIGGIVGYFIAAAAILQSVFRSTSSTAAVGILFVPFYSIAGAIPGLLLGYCLGYLREIRHAEAKKWRPLLAATLVMVISITLAVFIRQNIRLSRQIYEIQDMSAPGLAQLIDDPKLGQNKFILGAVAQNPNADAETLHRIIEKKDPDLYEAMGSIFDLLGANKKGLAVMRLVARHSQVAPEDIEYLAKSNNEYVLGDVAANEKISEASLRKLATRGGQLIEWGLARNSKAPADVLSNLAKSSDEYTRAAVATNPRAQPLDLQNLSKDSIWHVRSSVAGNPSTPPAILQELASDSDDRVSRVARERVKSL